MLTIIAEIKVKSAAEHFQRVLTALSNITPTVLKEDGCFAYDILVNHQSNAAYQAPLLDTIIMLEKWQSMQHLDQHLATAHMQRYQEQVKDDVLAVKISILENGNPV